MLIYDHVSRANWEERYKERLRQAIQNGVDYITPLLVDEFKSMDIYLIFTGVLSESPENRYLDFVYREPRIDEKSQQVIAPAIFFSEKERPAEQFHTKKEL